VPRALLTGCYARVVESVRDFTGDLMNLVYGILLVVGCILFCTDMTHTCLTGCQKQLLADWAEIIVFFTLSLCVWDCRSKETINRL